MVSSGQFINTCRDIKVFTPFPLFLPFPLQTMRISPGTRRIVSVVQVAVPSTAALVFPGREGKRERRAVIIFLANQDVGQWWTLSGPFSRGPPLIAFRTG